MAENMSFLFVPQKIMHVLKYYVLSMINVLLFHVSLTFLLTSSQIKFHWVWFFRPFFPRVHEFTRTQLRSCSPWFLIIILPLRRPLFKFRAFILHFFFFRFIFNLPVFPARSFFVVSFYDLYIIITRTTFWPSSPHSVREMSTRSLRDEYRRHQGSNL